MSNAATDAESEERVLNTIIQAGHLKDALGVLQTAVSEAIVHIGSHGIRVSCIDPSTVSMHNPLEIDASGFEHVPDGSFALGVNLIRLEDYLSKASPDDLVNLSFKPTTRMLNIQYGRVDVDLACIDPDTIRAEPDTNEIDLPNQFTIPVSDWVDALDVADLTSDHVCVVCQPDEEQVAVRAEGDTDFVEVAFGREDTLDPSKITDETESKFSLEYLTRIAKAMPSGEVSVSVGDEFPTILEYEFADGHGHVETMVAPRIDTS